MLNDRLKHYLKEVLGVQSVILPEVVSLRIETKKLWIVTEQKLAEKEMGLLDKMLKAVKMQRSDFHLVEANDTAMKEIKPQDRVLWFSDQMWSYHNAEIINLCAFKHFFELEGDALKDLKKSIWEKLKTFAFT